MDAQNLLSLLGGLAMFLFGMHITGKALKRRAGSRLKTILNRLSANPFKCFLLGLSMTFALQSSSTATVLVVGFVNSGVMLLSQAVYVIIGANVATASTAWVLALTGVRGDGLFLTLLKPSTFAPAFAAVGMVMYFFMKRPRRKDVALAFLGFSVLMFGMESMTTAVKALAATPQFSNILFLLSNPILGILGGTVFTAIIQSSSASVGILQMLSNTGMLSYATAIPIIVGQNIGTCASCMVAAIGARRDAKRAAATHLLFNAVGAVLWMITLYAADALIGLPFVSQMATPAGIALVHTAFKVLSAALLLPFGQKLVKLSNAVVRDARAAQETTLLDERLIIVPAIAIDRSRVAADAMARLSREALFSAFALINEYDDKGVLKITAFAQKMEKFEDSLGAYLVKLSGRGLIEKDGRAVCELLRISADFARICDQAVNIAAAARDVADKKIDLPHEIAHELNALRGAVAEIVDIAIAGFRENNLALTARVEPLRQVIIALKARVRANHIQRLRRGEIPVEASFPLCDSLTSLARVADLCANIAACVAESARDGFSMHRYLHTLETGAGSDFDKYYAEYAQKYALKPNFSGKNPPCAG